MKRIISLAMVVCISLVFVFSSCSQKHPIDEFKERMETAESYQMSVTMSGIPVFGSLTMIYKVDGNIQYVPAVELMEQPEYYLEVVGDTAYQYTKNIYGRWTKKQVTLEENSTDFTSEQMLNELFNSDNYEKVKDEDNTYRQKKDVVFDGFDEVTIFVGENSCTLEMNITYSGITVATKLVISKIGEVELTLPEIN